MLLRLLKGVPFVCDIQDLWPDSFSATGMLSSRPVLSMVGGFMKRVYASAEAITVLSPGFKTALERRGVAAHKLTIIPNWTVEAQDEPAARGRSPGDEDAFTVLYAGNPRQRPGSGRRHRRRAPARRRCP